MKILDAGRKQYSESTRHIGVIEVPEWLVDGEPAKIYVKKLTLGQELERQGYAMKSDYSNFQVMTLIYSACDQDMKPVFPNNNTGKDIIKNQLDGEIVSRLIADINTMHNKNNGGESGDDFDHEKKS